MTYLFCPHSRFQTVEVARAEAEKIRLIGGSEASAIEAVGKAEAERMRLKAAAYKQYGEAAMLNLVLETLPKVGIFIIVIIIYSLTARVIGAPRMISEPVSSIFPLANSRPVLANSP